MGKTDVDKLREVYDRMDKNDDGTVTYHELKQCIMESQGCTDDEADGILHTILTEQGADKNKDERISFEEFVAALQKAEC